MCSSGGVLLKTRDGIRVAVQGRLLTCFAYADQTQNALLVRHFILMNHFVVYDFSFSFKKYTFWKYILPKTHIYMNKSL